MESGDVITRAPTARCSIAVRSDESLLSYSACVKGRRTTTPSALIESNSWSSSTLLYGEGSGGGMLVNVCSLLLDSHGRMQMVHESFAEPPKTKLEELLVSAIVSDCGVNAIGSIAHTRRGEVLVGGNGEHA